MTYSGSWKKSLPSTRIEPLAEVPQVSRYSDLVKVTVTW